jgi:sugar phosphate isomerase/epimerase
MASSTSVGGTSPKCGERKAAGAQRAAGDDKSEKFADIDASEAHQFRGVGEIELPAPGLGALNYDLYLKRLAQHHPNIPIIIEHLDESDVPRAKRFLDDKLLEAGA